MNVYEHNYNKRGTFEIYRSFFFGQAHFQWSETTVNFKGASFIVTMLLHKGLTHTHSQIKPRLLFGESFTLRICTNTSNNWCNSASWISSIHHSLRVETNLPADVSGSITSRAFSHVMPHIAAWIMAKCASGRQHIVTYCCVCCVKSSE